MWTCKICETKNNERYERCCICLFEKTYSDNLALSSNINVEPSTFVESPSSPITKTTVREYDSDDILKEKAKIEEHKSKERVRLLKDEKSSTDYKIELEHIDDSEEFVFNSDKTILMKYKGTSRKVRVPNGVEMLGTSCFEGNKHIEIVSLPHTLTKISERAFANCSNLNKVSMSCSLTHIMKNAFLNCERLADFMISDRTKNIDKEAFSNCESLRIVCGLLSPAQFYAKKENIPYKIKPDIGRLKNYYCKKCWRYIAHFPNRSMCTNCSDSYW